MKRVFLVVAAEPIRSQNAVLETMIRFFKSAKRRKVEKWIQICTNLCHRCRWTSLTISEPSVWFERFPHTSDFKELLLVPAVSNFFSSCINFSSSHPMGKASLKEQHECFIYACIWCSAVSVACSSASTTTKRTPPVLLGSGMQVALQPQDD